KRTSGQGCSRRLRSFMSVLGGTHPRNRLLGRVRSFAIFALGGGAASPTCTEDWAKPRPGDRTRLTSIRGREGDTVENGVNLSLNVEKCVSRDLSMFALCVWDFWFHRTTFRLCRAWPGSRHASGAADTVP